MFNVDRDKLKAKIDDSINGHYAHEVSSNFYASNNGDSNNYQLTEGFNNIIRGLDARVQHKIQQAFELHTKTMLRHVMFDLIDSLYTADDFEKDLKLR
jgi:hypothetical protein